MKVLSVLFAAALLAACSSTTNGGHATLNGEVFYLQRMALPPGAQLTVILQDVSLADAPARNLAMETRVLQQQVPIRFDLKYDRSQVQPGHTYAVNARIENAGHLLFVTTERNAVTLDGNDPQPLRVRVDPAMH
ncbi:MAG: putative lipoprotein YbaY [Stenotrophomonas maltophilia]|nr:MAG: putative lipoprotein YbaY [Stenotrophomonas maltophilia]